MSSDDRLTMSVESAARQLGISRGLTYDLVRQGQIPCLKFGRRLLIPRQQFEAMLAGEWQPLERSNSENNGSGS